MQSTNLGLNMDTHKNMLGPTGLYELVMVTVHMEINNAQGNIK